MIAEYSRDLVHNSDKVDCMHQVEYARKLFNKVSDFLRSEGVL